MQHKTYLVVAFLLVIGCTKFEDAEMTQRNTFVHFYSSATNYIGLTAELDTDGGFILSGEIKKDNGVSDALIIKTDARGHKIWEKVIPHGIINAIKPRQNGYILLGDSIQMNTGSQNVEVSELVNSFARLLLMDAKGNILAQHITSGTVRRTVDNTPVDLTIDYHGSALAVNEGNIFILGSFRIPGENESTFVAAFDSSDIRDSLWYQSYYSLDNHDLFNCKALHLTPASGLVWASSNYTQDQNVSREYLSISLVQPNSTFKDYSVYGESDPRNHAVEDIQRSSVGYCAIGTYAETNGLNANMYFIRIDANLKVIPESARYIDGEELMVNNRLLDNTSKTSSGSFDQGLAIVATDDGYVLAGTMTSTPNVGNGGTDILLVKVDPFGNLLWKKLIGGSGDETVASIRETPDKGLLLCGTNTINGLSTMMLVKTDGNGNLDN